MKHPSFSICIPNYNYGHYIGETIQSILDQTYHDFEIIVADNASTDNSVEVIKSFDNERIRLIQNNYNIGYAPNLHKATSYARNDLILFLPSDDLLKPDTLETYKEVLLQCNCDYTNTILSGKFETLDKNGVVSDASSTSIYSKPFFNAHKATFKLRNDGTECFTFDGIDICKVMLAKIQIPCHPATMAYSRALWNRVEGYNAIRTLGPDKYFALKILSMNPNVVFIEKSLVQFRSHGSPMAFAQQSTVKQQIDDYLYTIEYSEEYLKTLGLTSKILIHEFLDRVCLKTGLTQLVYGTYKHALKTFSFAFAAYPVETLKRPRTYVLAFLLLLGPLSRLIAVPAYHFYQWVLRTKNNKTSSI